MLIPAHPPCIHGKAWDTALSRCPPYREYAELLYELLGVAYRRSSPLLSSSLEKRHGAEMIPARSAATEAVENAISAAWHGQRVPGLPIDVPSLKSLLEKL